MPPWLNDPSAAAWVQAIGSIFAILIAVWVPYRQRRNTLRDARNDRARQESEFLQRLTAGLRAEINAALDATARRELTLETTLKGLHEGRTKGASVANTGPIQPGSMNVTDAIIYRQTASELGRLPPDLINSVVQFYSYTGEFGQIADANPTAEGAYKIAHDLAPRLKIQAALLIKTLDKFEACGFAMNANIRPTPAEVKELAIKVGYPLEQIAKARGIQL